MVTKKWLEIMPQGILPPMFDPFIVILQLHLKQKIQLEFSHCACYQSSLNPFKIPLRGYLKYISIKTINKLYQIQIYFKIKQTFN